MIDHCTGWFEGWWAACCAAHDADYSAQIGQLLADGRLYDCVVASLPAFAGSHPWLTGAAVGASGFIAALMWVAVRVFGSPFYRRSRAGS